MPFFINDGRDFDAHYQDFSWKIPDSFNIGNRVCDRHEERADKPAIILENNDDEPQSVSFGQLIKSSNKFANALRGLGVESGERVVILLGTSVELAVAHIGSYKLGVIAVPLLKTLSTDTIEFCVQDSGAKVVVCDEQHLGLIDGLKESLPQLKFILRVNATGPGSDFEQILERSSEDFKAVKTAAIDPALLLYTEVPGKPPTNRIVQHQTLIGLLPGFELAQDFYPQSKDRYWTPLDWSSEHGLLLGLLPALASGQAILAKTINSADATAVLEICRDYQISNAFLPAHLLHAIQKLDLPAELDLKLRCIASAGDRLDSELLDWLQANLGIAINAIWSPNIAVCVAGQCNALEINKPGSLGKAYPGHQLEILDGQGHAVTATETGELAIQVNDPALLLDSWPVSKNGDTKESAEWIRSGQLAYRDADSYIWLVAQKPDLLQSAGRSFGPALIETALIKHPAVDNAVVVAKQSQLGQNNPIAYVLLSLEIKASDKLAEEILTSLKNKLAPHELPHEIEFLEKLPLDQHGEILRQALRDRANANVITNVDLT